MDEKKIFIVNLSKGRMGETNASLLGSMLTVKIYLAAMSRADEPASRMAKLPRFYFYVDEFQSMMNQAFADILSESRKYKLALTLANQYIEQMDEEVRDAVFGNVGTLIVFRVGPFDAEVLETVFQPTFMPEDLVGLGIGQIYLTLMIDGVGSAPFSAETIPPIEAPAISYRNDVVMSSRESYSRSRTEVEAEINRKQNEFVAPPKEKKERRDGPRSSNGWNASPQGGMSPREKFATTAQESVNPRGTLHSKIQEIQRDVEQSAVQEVKRAAERPVERVQPERIGHVRPQQVARPAQSARQFDPAARREAQENEHRNALKDAILKARGDQAIKTTPDISPLERMRQKNASKQNQQPREKNQHAQPPKTQLKQEAPKVEYEVPVQERAEPKHSHAQTPRHQHDHHHGEVSHRELQRVLNGTDRDWDDL